MNLTLFSPDVAPDGQVTQVAGAAFNGTHRNSAGDGILRYLAVSGLSGTRNEYWLAVGTLTGNKDQPFEASIGDIGPFNGLRINFWFRDINRSEIAPQDIAFQIYQKDYGEEQPSAFRYEPVTSSELAESIEACGTVSRLGQCSKDRR